MKGITALHGYKSKRDWSKRVRKPKRKFKSLKLCLLCQKEKIPNGRAIYCGSYKRKTGCSYIKHLERRRKDWKLYEKRHPEHNKEQYREWIKKHPDYQKIWMRKYRNKLKELTDGK